MPTTTAVRADVLADYQAGMKMADMMRKHKCGSKLIKDWADGAGLPPRRPGPRSIKPSQERTSVYALPRGKWVPNGRGIVVFVQEDVAS